MLKKWYVLYTKPRSEFKALLQLEESNIEAYLPTITITKQWKDRKKKVVEALFKSYIFIFADEPERYLALAKDAIVKTIFFNGKPAHVSQLEIDNLKKMLAKPERLEVFIGITKGSIVKVQSGPFEGIEGVVESISKDESTLSISVQMLNRTISTIIPSSTKIKRVN
jgi:transcription antitermination factor NusG